MRWKAKLAPPDTPGSWPRNREEDEKLEVTDDGRESCAERGESMLSRGTTRCEKRWDQLGLNEQEANASFNQANGNAFPDSHSCPLSPLPQLSASASAPILQRARQQPRLAISQPTRLQREEHTSCNPPPTRDPLSGYISVVEVSRLTIQHRVCLVQKASDTAPNAIMPKVSFRGNSADLAHRNLEEQQSRYDSGSDTEARAHKRRQDNREGGCYLTESNMSPPQKLRIISVPEGISSISTKHNRRDLTSLDGLFVALKPSEKPSDAGSGYDQMTRRTFPSRSNVRLPSISAGFPDPDTTAHGNPLLKPLFSWRNPPEAPRASNAQGYMPTPPLLKDSKDEGFLIGSPSERNGPWNTSTPSRFSSI